MNSTNGQWTRLTHAAVLIGAAYVLAANSGGRAPASNSEKHKQSTTLNFRFAPGLDEDGLACSSGLTCTFTRDLDTIDPTGGLVAEDEPRFDWPVSMTPVFAPTLIRATTAAFLMASGIDRDGETELMVLYDPGLADFIVLRGGSVNVNFSGTTLYNTECNDTIRTSSGARAGNMNDTVRVFPPVTGMDADTRFVPRTAAVFYGAIVVAGPIMVLNEEETEENQVDTFDLGGWGFIWNLDQGDPNDWTFLWSDLELSPQQVNHNRGQVWCLRAAPVYYERASCSGELPAPGECWFVCTDYRENGGPDNLISLGGRVYIFKITRDVSGQVPGAWTAVLPGAGNTGLVADLPRGGTDTQPGCHAHSAHMVEWLGPESEEQGVQVIVALGDGQDNQRFARLTLEDKDNADYDDLNEWTIEGDFHGKRRTTSGAANAGWSSQQPVGVAWGPVGVETRPTLLWGADEQSDWITQMTLPERQETQNPPVLQQAQFNFEAGFATGYGRLLNGDFVRHKPAVFLINQPRIECTDGPLATVLGDASSPSTSRFARVMYCHNVQSPEKWVQVAQGFGTSEGTAAIYGTNIYYVPYGATGLGLMRVQEPTAPPISFRPVVVAAGGKNALVDGFYIADGDHATAFEEMEKVDGEWQDDADFSFLPQPPSIGVQGQLYKFASSTSATSIVTQYIAEMHVSGTASNLWDTSTDPNWETGGEKVRRYRAWVKGSTYNRAATLSPNKTLQLSSQAEDGESTTEPAGAPTKYTSESRWCPATLIGRVPIASDRGLGIRIRSNFASGNALDENVGYYLVDYAGDGNGSLPYPLPPRSASAAADDHPDELLTVSGSLFALQTGDSEGWMVRLAGMHPVGNWDQYAERRDGSDADIRYWPLFTLWASDTNWIEFAADCVNRGYRIRLKAGSGAATTHSFGQGKLLWLPDSPLYVALAYNSTTDRLYIGASLGGDEVRTVADSGDGINVASLWTTGNLPTFTELRFRGAPDTVGNNEVNEYRWLGGELEIDETFTNSSMGTAFEDIDFLSWTP